MIGRMVNGAGRLAGAMLIPLIVLVLLGVLVRLLGRNELISWPISLPIIGRGITANTLIEMQSFIFAILFLFGGANALRYGEHVAVDVLSKQFSRTSRSVIETICILALILPFLLVVGWASIGFVQRSWTLGETSFSGSITHIFIFKAAIPISLALIALESLAQLVRNVSTLIKGDHLHHD